MGEQREYQRDYYKSHKEEISLRRIAKRRPLTDEELRMLSYHQVERVMDKDDPEASRFAALGFMRTGYSYGDDVHKEAAATLVAERFGLLTGGGYPDIKKVFLWYEEALEREKVRLRELRRRPLW